MIPRTRQHQQQQRRSSSSLPSFPVSSQQRRRPRQQRKQLFIVVFVTIGAIVFLDCTKYCNHRTINNILFVTSFILLPSSYHHNQQHHCQQQNLQTRQKRRQRKLQPLFWKPIEHRSICGSDYKSNSPLLTNRNAIISSFPSAPWTKTPSLSSSPTSTALQMVLIPLNVDEINTLISVTGKPTPQQYGSYFGRTAIERYNRILEASIVALLGVCMSYFLSFVLGGFVATILGTISLLWGILSPELKAYQRNWEFIGGRPLIDDTDNDNVSFMSNAKKGLYGALFIGSIEDVCVVEDASSSSDNSDEYDLREFMDYTMENDELEKYTGQPYLIRLVLRDETDRVLQIHARMSEEYLSIRPGMAVSVLLLSKDSNFRTLAALTDVFILLLNNGDESSNNSSNDVVLVGDYPYLDRAGIEEFFRNEPDVWNILVKNHRPSFDEPYVDDEDSMVTNDLISKSRRYRSDDVIVDDNDYDEEDGGYYNYYTTNSVNDHDNDDDDFYNTRKEQNQRRRRRPLLESRDGS